MQSPPWFAPEPGEATAGSCAESIPARAGQHLSAKGTNYGPPQESDAELHKKSEMEKTCPPSLLVMTFHTRPSHLKLQARSTVAFKLLKHQLTLSGKQSAEAKVRSSSLSVVSNHKILYMKKQVGYFHDLQLYFLQLHLIPLLLEPASFPNLLLYLPKYPSLAHAAFLRETALEPAATSHCTSSPPNSHHLYSTAVSSNSCNTFGAKCRNMSLLHCYHLLCVGALRLYLFALMPFTLLTYYYSQTLSVVIPSLSTTLQNPCPQLAGARV